RAAPRRESAPERRARPSGEGARTPPPGGAGHPPLPQPGDTYAVTLEMFKSGHSFAEIARARDVKVQTILRHLLVLADRGETFDLSQHIKPELLGRVREAAAEWTYGQALAPVKGAAGYCTYDDLKIHLAQVLMERHTAP
ncbi:MAG: helix-turn-helix domain-containing protein, partial [Myxococcota bacterium]